MTREELKSNLGTIARSGSKAFLQELKQAGGEGAAVDSKDETPAGALDGIIGQFGVGFYSAFMVGENVTVHTRSARDGSRSVWASDGSGEFTIKEAEPAADGQEEMPRGCKVVVKLREGCEEYATQVRAVSCGHCLPRSRCIISVICDRITFGIMGRRFRSQRFALRTARRCSR